MLEQVPSSNPFSTRFTRPGQLPYRFADQRSVPQLLRQLKQQQWRGAIIGPHGTGKTTLLHSLIPQLEERGRTIRRFTLQTGQRSLPNTNRLPASPTTQLIIDGYEQLGWWARLALARRCRRQGWGLLVTSHHNTNLPPLFRTATTLSTLQHLVDDLQRHAEIQINRLDVAKCYQQQQGNIRETLFSLYDLYEQQIRTPSLRASSLPSR